MQLRGERTRRRVRWLAPRQPHSAAMTRHTTEKSPGCQFPVCFARKLLYVPLIMFEKIKVQLPAAEEKVAHLRRFL
jgi:hypothetical protein